MKRNGLRHISLALLSGALASACGAGVEAPSTWEQTEGASEMRPIEQLAGLSPESTFIYALSRPYSGESYAAGQTVTIEWGIIVGTENLLAPFVNLDLYKGGRFHSTIASSVPVEQWTYGWQIPAGFTSGSQYSIRLSDSSDPSRYYDGSQFVIQGTGCDFRFEVASLYVQRDQRTATFNYEGKLELAGVFHASNTVTPRYPATGELSMNQGLTYSFELFIADVQVQEPLSVPVAASLWEIEHGAQGDNDFGSTPGSMSLSCAQSTVTQDLSVTLSDDSALEREGLVIAKIRARRL